MSLRHGFVRAVKTATIEDEGSLSDAVQLEGLNLEAIIVPSGWTAADITFQASADGGTTWYNVHDSGGDTELTVQAAASRYIGLLEAAKAPLRGAPRLKVRSGTAGSAVAQTSGPIELLLILGD